MLPPTRLHLSLSCTNC